MPRRLPTAGMRCALLAGVLFLASVRGGEVLTPHPILFVTQTPTSGDFTAITATFGNHTADPQRAPRGGALYIRYEDGTLKNLTLAAGFGKNGGDQTGDAASKGVTNGGIAVRDPHVHWSGTKALFSMVVGSPTQYQTPALFWQMYEITGLGKNDTPVITKIANQPATFNNITPIYGTDERIIFTTDRPRSGLPHHYPQLDEYESTPVVTGLWSLDPATGSLFQMNHTPSGAFSPFIDSYGRVIFTRWDHLLRDQQADADRITMSFGTFDFTDESAGATALFNTRVEVFPEPRSNAPAQLVGTNFEGLQFNQFFPWQINEDGTDEEIINHAGRHELLRYFNRVFNDDPNLVEQSSGGSYDGIELMLQLTEDPQVPGRYYGVDCPEFGTRSAGRIIRIDAPLGGNADAIVGVQTVTHPDTASVVGDNETASADHSGLYRDPRVLSDGTLIAAHTSETRQELNEGTREAPNPRYKFRLKALVNTGGIFSAGQPLTAGIQQTITFYDPDVFVTYTGEMWELQPVEVRARTKPSRLNAPPLAAPEDAVFQEEGVNPADLQAYLKQNNLALVISRDVTTRDASDKQQPFNLKIEGTTKQTLGAGGKIYDVKYMQFFQGDQIRGIGWKNASDPVPASRGRRVLARAMHDPAAVNPPSADGGASPEGSVELGADGSMAAFIPARRAMSWQLTNDAGTPVVRERYWISFQPGEIRLCASCHGVNTTDQAGNPPPQNKPEALRTLLKFWKAGGGTGGGGGGGGETDPTGDPDNDGLPNASDSDDDNDGFSDDLETATGSDPRDPLSLPSGISGGPLALNLLKLDLKLNFARAQSDSAGLSATLPVAAGFTSTGQPLVVDIGGVVAGFTLDAKARAAQPLGSVKLQYKKKKGTVEAQSGKLSARLGRGAFAAKLADEGFTSADASKQPRSVSVSVLFGGQHHQATKSLSYTAKAGKSGRAR